MTRRYFGTDGVRGPYGGPVINEIFAARLGRAAGRWLQGRGVASRRVLLGRDTRASGPARRLGMVGQPPPASSSADSCFNVPAHLRSKALCQESRPDVF